MFSKVANAISHGYQTMSLAQLMRIQGIRSFASKFQFLQFSAALLPRKQKYVNRYPYSSKREQRRRLLQDAHLNQLNSHKPGTVQPAHIFG